MMITGRCAAVALSVLVGAAAGAGAGPIDPPAGAVAPTMKTLAQVEPRIAVGAETTPGSGSAVFEIREPGSYYLTGDVQGVAGMNGIEIAAENVTLDLNGFTLRGVPGSLSGVSHSGQARMVSVSNGFVEGWGGRGVALAQGLLSGSNSVDRVSVRNCGMVGVVVAGSVSRSVSQGNGGGGFEVSGEGWVRDCTASGNTGVGFAISGRYIVEGCVSSGNTAHGFVVAGGPSHVRACTAQANGNSGIQVMAAGSIIEGNACRGNGVTTDDGAGIQIVSGHTDVRVDSNHVSQNDMGIRVDGSSCFIIRNTARTNSQNYVINGAGNVYGPIVNTTGQISSTNPWANFGV